MLFQVGDIIYTGWFRKCLVVEVKQDYFWIFAFDTEKYYCVSSSLAELFYKPTIDI